MMRSSRSIRSTCLFIFGFALLLASLAGAAQNTASRPLADPSDHRFDGVTESFSALSTSGSHLHAVEPLGGFIDDTHANYTVQLLQLQWRWGDPIDVYVIKPKGVRKPPVILNLYGYPADTDAYKNEVFQEALTKDGFAAVGFVSALTGHRYHDRPMKQWFLSELQESLVASVHDVQMLLNFLEGRNDLDTSRIGMFGQGSGATIAIMASAVDRRIKVLDVLDPWGDWPEWLKTSPFVPQEERADYLQPAFLKTVADLETIDWVPKIQAARFRLQQNAFETDTPKVAKDKIRSAVPLNATTVIYKTLPDFVAAFPNSTNLQWVESQLRLLPAIQD